MPFAKPYWVWQLLCSQVSFIWVQGTLPATYYSQKFKHSQFILLVWIFTTLVLSGRTIHNNYYSLHLTQCILLFRNEWSFYITCTCLSHCHGHRHKVQHNTFILLWCAACVTIKINLVLSSNLLFKFTANTGGMFTWNLVCLRLIDIQYILHFFKTAWHMHIP